MNSFRSYTPKRRYIKTIVSDCKEHRDDLRIDYKNRCGYCNDIDTWRFSWFEIDHFVPKKYLVTISSVDYSNLVYACRSCNNAKRAKWPTGDEGVHNQNNEGFVDPCDDDYNNNFTRTHEGRIIPLTKLGEWMYRALMLYKPQHEIIWNIEQLDLMINEIEELIEVTSTSDLTDKLLNSYRGFREYINKLSKVS